MIILHDTANYVPMGGKKSKTDFDYQRLSQPSSTQDLVSFNQKKIDDCSLLCFVFDGMNV